MKIKLPFVFVLALLASILHCLAPVPYVVNFGQNATSITLITNINFPVSSSAAANYAWIMPTQGNLALPATYFGAGNPNQITAGWYPGLNYLSTNGNVIAGIACLGDHNGGSQPSELFFESEGQIAFNPSLGANGTYGGFGYFQMGVAGYPMESFVSQDGFFSSAGYNDLWTSNTIGHSFGLRLPAYWTATNSGGTLIASGLAGPGIVGYSSSNTNMAPGAPANVGTGGGEIGFFTVLPYTTGANTYSNVPSTEVMRIHTNSVEILAHGGLTIDSGASGSPFVINDSQGTAAIHAGAFGVNQVNLIVGGADITQVQLQDQSFHNVFLFNEYQGVGIVAGQGAAFNAPLRIGDGQTVQGANALETFGNVNFGGNVVVSNTFNLSVGGYMSSSGTIATNVYFSAVTGWTNSTGTNYVIYLAYTTLSVTQKNASAVAVLTNASLTTSAEPYLLRPGWSVQASGSITTIAGVPYE